VAVPTRVLLLTLLLFPVVGMAQDEWAGDFFPELVEPLPAQGLIPARSQPDGPAPVVAWRFNWDTYQSLVVVSPAGKSRRSTAWVVTYDHDGSVVVAYRAVAFTDVQGVVHIDARRALVSGPMADDWSPDSFAFTADGMVSTIDDYHRANTGKVLEQIAGDTPAYRQVLAIAVATVRESS